MTASIATRALEKTMSYLAPRLAPRAQGIDLSPMFENIDAANYRQSIPALVNSIAMATDGMLAYDANTQELTQELQSVAPQASNANTPNAGGYPPEIIERVRRYLEKLVTPQVLQAAMQILGGGQGATPAAQNPMSNPPPPSDMGEDSRGGPHRFSQDPRSRQDFFDRFPAARRMKVEPSYAGPPPKAPTPVHGNPSVAPFSERFPGVRAPKHV